MNWEDIDRSKQLEAQLAEASLLHRLSVELIQEDEIAGLYKKIVEAAKAILHSQYATMQILYPDSGSGEKLRLLASSGFTPEAEKYWEWVNRDTGSSCGVALRARTRAVVQNFETADFMQDKPTLPKFLEAGIYAAQSTPLHSRNGKLLGMISTHWTYPHKPSEQSLHLLDILARQAADLIERSQTAELLKQSEGRLRAFTTATSDVIYRMSPDWKEMYYLDGRNFLSDTGESSSDWQKKYIIPEDQELVTETVNNAIATKSIFQLEHRVVRADGTVGWTSSRAVPIFDRDGRIVEWFGTASDITDKKSLMSELEDRVEERTKELHRSNEDLQQFAHVASHDLKEPVRKVKTFGLLLKDELYKHEDGKSESYVDKILDSANRMSTMIEGVLTYSSIDSIDQEVETLDPNSILSDIRSDLEVLIDQKEAVIQSNELPKIEGVRVLIYQLFYNLINNSLKFSKKEQKPVIKITGTIVSNGKDTFARIEVSDNGIGFEPKHAEVIFNTFIRLNAKDRYDGTGLGLALAKKIVERHHGTIEASGKQNAGATFTIRLPVVRPTE